MEWFLCGGTCGVRSTRTGLSTAATLLLNSLNRGAQPIPDVFLEFELGSLALHGVDGFSRVIQGDVVAGNFFTLKIARHKVGKQAIAAGVRARRIVEIYTG